MSQRGPERQNAVTGRRLVWRDKGPATDTPQSELGGNPLLIGAGAGFVDGIDDAKWLFGFGAPGKRAERARLNAPVRRHDTAGVMYDLTRGITNPLWWHLPSWFERYTPEQRQKMLANELRKNGKRMEDGIVPESQ